MKLPAPKSHSSWLHSPADADRLLEGELITARYGDDKVHYTVPIGKPGQITFFKELPDYREIATWVAQSCTEVSYLPVELQSASARVLFDCSTAVK